MYPVFTHTIRMYYVLADANCSYFKAGSLFIKIALNDQNFINKKQPVENKIKVTNAFKGKQISAGLQPTYVSLSIESHITMEHIKSKYNKSDFTISFHL
jgi:hypothetical protein